MIYIMIYYFTYITSANKVFITNTKLSDTWIMKPGEELKAKIDSIIAEIMDHINKQEFECPCCNGQGTTDKSISVPSV